MMVGFRACTERHRRAHERIEAIHPMKIHEYQAKAILARHGVPVPEGEVVQTAAEAEQVARRLGSAVTVVKAQIHAGGRGKGGGVKVVRNVDEVYHVAEKMIGMHLVTYQTGARGQTVGRVLVEQGLSIARELYLGIVIDRSSEKPVLMVSPEGGVEIEKVAEETPERIFKEYIHPGIGLAPYQARKLAFALGLSGAQIGQATKFMSAVWEAFRATDASLVEINPLIVTATARSSRSTRR
jgi:succinyl-CoA synthetase beta subunit